MTHKGIVHLRPTLGLTTGTMEHREVMEVELNVRGTIRRVRSTLEYFFNVKSVNFTNVN